MTTFLCKSRGPRGQVHERMGHHGKVTPQVTLSFPPGGPPILDPAPAPAKPRGHWWSHLTSMFTSQPPVCWVTPQLVREPPMAHYNGPLHQYNMPPPALNPGEGLWHAAPPGNQQQQLMMDPLLMLQGNDTNGYFPMAKMNSSCYYPMSKTETNGFFPVAKETNGYYPTAKIETDGVFPMTKTDRNSFFVDTKVNADSYFPAGKTEADSFSQTANTHRQTYTNSWPSVEPSTTTSTTTSKPLNPYAQEWVPPGYMTTPVPGTANITITKPLMVGEEMPNHHYEHHHSTPVIPYTPQEFSEMTEKVEEVRINASPPNPPPSATSVHHLPSGSVLECQSITEQGQRDDNVKNVALPSPSGTLRMSASIEVGSPSHSSHSQDPLCYQESEGDRGPSESAVMSPGVTSTVSPAMVTPSAKKTETGIMFSPQSLTSLGIPGSDVSPDNVQMCVELPASPDCVKNARPDPAKSIPITSSSSGSPRQDQQGCVELLSGLDCAKNVRPDPALSNQHTNPGSESPEGQSSAQTSNSAPETWKSSPESISASPTSPEGQSPTQTSGNASEICLLGPECKASSVIHLENDTLEQRCQNLRIDDVCSLEVPGSVKEGSDSASMSSNAKGVPDSANRSSSASLSYARMVERVTPSPPPPPPEQDRYRGVEQPIPKIFRRDQTPPRETPTPKIEAQRLPELFRRPSKSQRTRSRKFLQELKESSQNGDGGVWCPSSPSSVSSTSSVSSSSSSSSSCELSQSPNLSHMPSSPSHTIPSSSSPPSSPVPISPLHCVQRMPRSTPQAIPLSPSTPVSPSRPAESPNRARSESESSTASLDIDFVDEVDRIPAIHPPSTPNSTSASRRPINRFLACILGSGDSESEDEEDWDDWDEVCVDGDVFAAPHDLDDSWETFGLEMVVMQCQTEPAKQCQNKLPAQCQVWPEIQCRCELPAECRLERKESEVQRQNGLPPKCQIDLTIQCQNVLPAECQMEDTRTEDQTDTSYLAEINERWEREVEQEVQGKSATRVTFGSTKVHPMVVWGHAYREARRGPWEQQARDRARFKQRIGTAELALSWILQPSHRTAVYERLHAPNATTTTTTTTPS